MITGSCAPARAVHSSANPLPTSSCPTHRPRSHTSDLTEFGVELGRLAAPPVLDRAAVARPHLYGDCNRSTVTNVTVRCPHERLDYRTSHLAPSADWRHAHQPAADKRHPGPNQRHKDEPLISRPNLSGLVTQSVSRGHCPCSAQPTASSFAFLPSSCRN